MTKDRASVIVSFWGGCVFIGLFAAMMTLGVSRGIIHADFLAAAIGVVSTFALIASVSFTGSCWEELNAE